MKILKDGTILSWIRKKLVYRAFRRIILDRDKLDDWDLWTLNNVIFVQFNERTGNHYYIGYRENPIPKKTEVDERMEKKESAVL